MGASMRGHLVCRTCGRGEQSREVVAQHLGGEILLDGEVGQARHVLDVESMFETLEGLFDGKRPPTAPFYVS